LLAVYRNIRVLGFLPKKIGEKRDYFTSNSDWFGVIIDTFNDKENGEIGDSPKFFAIILSNTGI
jgi:hypothetical protein